ncbi:hypothetical protein Ae201684_006064 [Aphanomyces euteiches]|uniref:Uncharacterized protein n=1 Tax=Aphanomyces euteiches TaxID=100861 RepID=A0A6G0XCY7_9STRA|nr:hypothetical protein Ae201684_006064 [Aphanomyces euteiches]
MRLAEPSCRNLVGGWHHPIHGSRCPSEQTWSWYSKERGLGCFPRWPCQCQSMDHWSWCQLHGQTSRASVVPCNRTTKL